MCPQLAAQHGCRGQKGSSWLAAQRGCRGLGNPQLTARSPFLADRPDAWAQLGSALRSPPSLGWSSADVCLVSREATAGGLQPLFQFVRDALEPGGPGAAAWGRPVLLVDDLSVLLGLGAGAGAVLDFVHRCRARVCCRLQVRGGQAQPVSLPAVLSLWRGCRSVEMMGTDCFKNCEVQDKCGL